MRLEARGLGYRVGSRWLLEDVSLSVSTGGVLAVVGPNGAGKSTLIRLLAGELRPSAGTVLVDERPLDAYPPRELALRRAVMPQSTYLAFAFTVHDVVLMGRHPHLDHHDEGPADLAAVDSAMRRTDTLTLSERRFPTLSGGEQARVTLARVLAQATPILLLDEPTAHLDPRHQHATLAVAREAATAGATVVAVLHDLNLAATYAEGVLLLAEGKIVAAGRPRDVLTAERLQQVFGIPFLVTTHPTMDCPLVIPTPGAPSLAGANSDARAPPDPAMGPGLPR